MSEDTTLNDILRRVLLKFGESPNVRGTYKLCLQIFNILWRFLILSEVLNHSQRLRLAHDVLISCACAAGNQVVFAVCTSGMV